MADVTGALHVEHEGKTHTLRLTFRGIGELQGKYGNTISGLLDGSSGDVPDFRALVDMVSVSLQRGEGLPRDQADDLADEMITADASIVERLITVAFPDATEDPAGNAERPTAAA